jgi:polyisoprenoid-binding protein YceI
MSPKKYFLLVIVPVIFFGFCFLPVSEWKTKEGGGIIKFSVPAGAGDTGRFTQVETAIKFDSTAISKSSIKATVSVNSISTGDKGKNAHLLSEEFFDAEKFPKIIFTSTQISRTKNGYTATGKLQIKKTVKAISFPFSFSSSGASGIFKGEMQILAGDFGVMKKSKSGADKIIVTLEFPVVKQ